MLAGETVPLSISSEFISIVTFATGSLFNAIVNVFAEPSSFNVKLSGLTVIPATSLSRLVIDTFCASRLLYNGSPLAAGPVITEYAISPSSTLSLTPVAVTV